MRRQINGSLFVFAAESVLAACASNAPVSADGKASPSASTPTAAGEKDPNAGSGYRRVTKNSQQYFCKREGVTGSRTEVAETCLTQAQMDAARNNSQDLLRRLQNVPGNMSTGDGNGGATNSVMGH
jgi:hypothetical protein